MIRTKIYSILLLVSLLTGCLSSVAREGLNQVQKNGDPLFISEILLINTPISPVRMVWYNPGPRTIAQVRFSVSVFNQVGDKIHEEDFTSRGPHLPMSEKAEESPANRVWWLADWYRPTMTCVLIEKIELTFEDDTTLTIDTKERLHELIADDVVKTCKK